MLTSPALLAHPARARASSASETCETCEAYSSERLDVRIVSLRTGFDCRPLTIAYAGPAFAKTVSRQPASRRRAPGHRFAASVRGSPHGRPIGCIATDGSPAALHGVPRHAAHGTGHRRHTTRRKP